jgi:hypothetical protein
VNLYIYVTSHKRLDSLSLASTDHGATDDGEKGKEGMTDQAIRLPNIQQGRPDVFDLVTYCISQCGLKSRVGVGACGPTKMIQMTRKAVSQGTYDTGPSLTLHTEVSYLMRYSVILC